MHATRSRRLVVLTAALTLFAAPAAWGSTAVVGALQQVSGSSPFAGCTADQLATQPGTNVPNSEVEPSVAAGGVDRNGDGAPDVIVGYQQDRWSDGGARGRRSDRTPGGDQRHQEDATETPWSDHP